MNLKLGLVRVAGYGIIAGSLCLKVCGPCLVRRSRSFVLQGSVRSHFREGGGGGVEAERHSAWRSKASTTSGKQ